MVSDAELWSHRNFRFLFSARLADTAGNAIAPVALAFAVLDLTGSTADIGYVVGARSIALVILLLLGGVLADRWPRSVVLVWSNLVSSATQAVIAALVLTGNATIGMLVILSFANGAAAAVSFPASGALITETVPRTLLQRANALLASGTNTVNLVGLVGGAALVAAVGPGWGLAIDAASFGATALLFSRLRLAKTQRGQATMIEDLRVGWTAFIARSWIWATVLCFLVVNAANSAAVNVLGPAVADDGIGRARWGLVLGVQTAGVVTATLIISRVNRPLRLWSGLAIATLIVPWMFALGVSPTFAPLAVTAWFAGLGYGYFGTAWETNLQANIDGDLLARVYSFDMLGSIIALPIGQLAIGPLAEAFGRRASLVGAAAVSLAACVVALAVPAIRQLPAPRLDSGTSSLPSSSELT